jgi:hypothetical protein
LKDLIPFKLGVEKNQMWNISRFLAMLHLSINQRRKGQSLIARAFKAF